MSTKSYLVLSDFWHRNVMVEAGSIVDMAEAEAKYLLHALMPAPAEPVAEVVTDLVVAIEADADMVADKVSRRIRESLKTPVDGPEA